MPRSAIHRHPLDLTAGGRRLGALWLEPPDGPAEGAVPLVFLHEGLGSIAQWTARNAAGPRAKRLDVPAALVAATGCPALVYERLGFGVSDPLPGLRQPDYLHTDAWRILPEVLDHAGIGRAILIGHSDGGSIALLFAARFPERSAAVVSEAAHVFVEEITLAGIRAAHAAYHAPGSRLRAALTRFHGAKTDQTFAAWADVWLRPDFAAFDMTGELPRIVCPVLAIQGEGDEYGSPAQLDAIAAGVAGPVETWLVPDCRHVPHHQAADRVLPRIAGFIRQRLGLAADAGSRSPDPGRSSNC